MIILKKDTAMKREIEKKGQTDLGTLIFLCIRHKIEGDRRKRFGLFSPFPSFSPDSNKYTAQERETDPGPHVVDYMMVVLVSFDGNSLS